MVVLTLTRKVNKAIGPFLLRNGVALRYALGRGVISDNTYLDTILMINLAQRIVSLEVHDDSLKALRDSRRVQSALDEWAENTFDGIFGKSEEEELRKNMSEAELRIEVLENYLRPALLKNERWSDVSKWQFNNRVLKWARAEFLMAKYGPALQEALAAYPKLRYSPQLAISPTRRGLLKLTHGSKIEDTTNTAALPQTSLVEKAFEMQDWKKTKDIHAEKQHMERLASKLGGDIVEIRGGSLRFSNIPHDADLSKMALEDILEVAGGHVSFCGPMNALCEERNIYQLWTKEYVELLADYLLKRTSEFSGETVILDVGAGDGLLAKYLRVAISGRIRPQSTQGATGRNKGKARQHRPASGPQHSQNDKTQKVPTIAAVDDGSWKIMSKADVENISVEEALKQHSGVNTTQLIILCSWMPMGVDWSSLFRKYNASEYILIGECDVGSCGDNWETWGNRAVLSDIGEELAKAMPTSIEGEEDPKYQILDDNATSESQESALPPYEIDGYQRIDINDLVPYQFSRFDSSVSRNGKTVTFRVNSCS